MAKVTACEKDRDAAVLMCARPLNIPASSNGQHQLPMSAGIESIISKIATHTDRGLPSGRASPANGSSPVPQSWQSWSSISTTFPCMDALFYQKPLWGAFLLELR